MKIKIYTKVILFCVCALNSLTAQTWTTQQVGITTSSMQRMFFINLTTGYSSLTNSGSTGRVIKTTNAGINWTTIVTTCTNYTYDVNFLDENTGFTCSLSGEISKTTNSGANWTTVYANGSSNFLSTMGFFDANTGFSAGNSYVARTTNGGNNWTEIPLAGYQYSNAVLSSTKAIICGSQTGNDGGVWTSTDAGLNWNYVQLDATHVMYDIYFADANTGYATGNGGGLAYKTTNGGANWTALNPFTTYQPAGIYFQDANTGFIGGSSGSVFKTTNGGTNFTQCATLPLIVEQSNYDIVFFDANNGIMCGGAGALYKTSDAGLNWITIGNNQRLNAITFPNSSTGYAAGESSSFQKTTDGGNTWQNLQSFSNISASSNSMEFTDASTGYIATGGGIIIKTTDGGASWNALTTGITFNIFSLEFIDANTGYLGSTNVGGMRMTTNGGTNWTGLTTGASTNINSISFPGANTGYFCSTIGIVRKTTNAGTNWTLLTTGVGVTLNSIYFLDDNNGFAVGSAGTVIKTTNGGTNWINLTTATGTTQILNSVRFADVNNGIIVGNAGTILVTSNGGTNWTAQTSNTTAPLRSVFIQASNNVFVAGNSGTILNSLDQLLPVELSSFTSSVSTNDVVLNWNTVMEENNSGFDVERNSFGAGWTKIGFVAGKGTTNISQNYSFADNGLNTGRYSYRLKQIDYNGNYKYYDLQNEVVIGVPSKFALMQNYPNPFNPVSIINYQLAINSFVTLKVYDLSGREVSSLVNEVKNAGYYSVQFDAKNLSSGTYFYKLTSDKLSDVKKMVVVK